MSQHYLKHTKRHRMVEQVSLQPLRNALIVGLTAIAPIIAFAEIHLEAENANYNKGMQFEITADEGGGQNAGWIDAQDFLNFDIIAPKAGRYEVSYRVASPNNNATLVIGEGGQDLSPHLAIPNTQGWQNWATIKNNIDLTAGTHTLTLYAVTGGWNVNWIKLTEPEQEPPTGTLPMVRADGKHWVADGEPVQLRGINLGNWLQLEFWMTGGAMKNNTGNINDQCTLEATLDSRFGYAERERLMDVFRNNWMTDRDWDNIASMGFNVVRLPFPSNLIEDENNPYTLRPDAWEYLDKAITKAAERGMYTILDLHGAAGSQGWEHHSGCEGRNWYWDGGNGHDANYYQDRTHWLWDMIAQRYNRNSDVAAYGLLNEPWGTDAVTLGNNLAALYHTVRAKDAEHVIIMSGHTSGISSFPQPGNDVAYEMHFYPGFWGWREGDDASDVHADWLFCSAPTGSTTCEWAEQINIRQAPFLIGEFQPWTLLGQDAGEITRKTFDVYNAQGWAATAWAYKTTVTTAHSGNAESGWPWGLFTNTSGYGNINMSTASVNDIESWFSQFSTQTLAGHPDVNYWMNYQATAGNGTIEAEHFQQYSGVNIEVTSDPIGGDFNASYLDTADWMVYNVNVPSSGQYQLQYRVASPYGGTVSASEHNGINFGDTQIPVTGGWQKWQTINGPTVYLSEGMHDLSLYVGEGGWNINWWQLVPQ